VQPRVHVWSNDPVNEGDAVSVPFVVRNEGYVAMNSVSFVCRVAHVRMAQRNPSTNRPGGSNEASIQMIGSGSSATVPCVLGSLGGGRVIEADVDVIVTYRHALSPWRTEERFRFGGYGAGGGGLRFFARTTPK
jgi:hypothetical protein